MLNLKLKTPIELSVEADGFTPDRFADQSLEAVRRAKLWVGSEQVAAGELFDITGNPSDGEWQFAGDLSRVHRLGAGMELGVLRVAGSVGRHAGAQMLGGKIIFEGDAGDWLGAEMRGGAIEVAGNAGDYVGGAYRGSPRGMRGGRIIVRGNAGGELGQTMRRGMIVVGGNVGELAGYRMKAGTIFVFGTAGPRAGAEMLRGTIGLFAKETAALLPTFRPACEITPQFLGLLGKELKASGFDVPSSVELYNGDLLTGGRGEILLPC